MKIHYLDTWKLKVQKTAAGFWGVLLLGNSISILALLLATGEARIICHRTELEQGNCQMIRSSWLIHEKRNLKLSDLKSAEIIRSKHSDQETGDYSYGVALRLFKTQDYFSQLTLSDDTQIPFTLWMIGNSSAKYDMEQIISRINQFIHNPQQTTIDVRNRATDAILPLVTGWFLMTLIFATIVDSESYSNCIFDRHRNCFTLTRRQWLRIQDVVEHSLDEIAAIEIETSDGGMGDVHRINIKLKSGQNVPLTQHSDSIDYRQTVISIQQFLNLSRV